MHESEGPDGPANTSVPLPTRPSEISETQTPFADSHCFSEHVATDWQLRHRTYENMAVLNLPTGCRVFALTGRRRLVGNVRQNGLVLRLCTSWTRQPPEVTSSTHRTTDLAAHPQISTENRGKKSLIFDLLATHSDNSRSGGGPWTRPLHSPETFIAP